jgi:hypothetical protein
MYMYFTCIYKYFAFSLSLLPLLGLIACVCGYSQYQSKLPNGDNVPHPCKPNYIWHGVGHKNALGGGERNPFGLDFKAKQLTVSLAPFSLLYLFAFFSCMLTFPA